MDHSITFTTIEPPGAFNSIANDINDSGEIVGHYNGQTMGFLFSGGIYSSIKPSDNLKILEVNGINNYGQIVGSYSGGSGSHGFVTPAIPEPATIELLGIGLAGLACAEVRRRQRKLNVSGR